MAKVFKLVTLNIRGVNCIIQNLVSDPLGRYIILKVAIENKICLNIFAPNKNKLTCQFLKKQKI